MSAETITEIREFINDPHPWKRDGYGSDDFYYWCTTLMGEIERLESEGVIVEICDNTIQTIASKIYTKITNGMYRLARIEETK